jgi:(1->4)-alpha-D-glucan 1-alpha-D-glucosylmutase
LQPAFNFRSATAIVPYLARLGISHLYLSPIFQARPGSTYGYDVVNHSTINEELGTIEEFRTLATTARRHGLGIILDIVPNHMAVMAEGNRWWLDVLENGPASKYSMYFDIDWTPLRASMRNRLLIPILENRYGDELNASRLTVRFNPGAGSFSIRYFDHCVPLDPQQYPLLFIDARPLTAEDPWEEFKSVIEEFGRLPDRCCAAGESLDRRQRDKEILKRRLARLCAREPGVLRYIESAVESLNGRTGDPGSFDALARVLDAQPYRLAYWKVAGDEINYRRFFDVNQLAALRVEHPDVFDETHAMVFQLLREGCIDGVRIDHVDGLHDPYAYLHKLRKEADAAASAACYIAVEKILASHERLREDWPVAGATGYEFGSWVVGWLLSEKGMPKLDAAYRHFTHTKQTYEEVLYECKKLLMRTSLAAEIAVLGVQLDRVAQAHRDTADFTQFALRDALTEVIAAFPIYRTYVSSRGASADDRQSIQWAIGAARSRNKGGDRTIFDFVESVLLCNDALANSAERRAAILEFTCKFQQVTGPVMAKSAEDTAFYRFYRLCALNEVGSDPRLPSLSNGALHKALTDRAQRSPHAMSATSTHDSKRGEDVRYRLCVLSEYPKEWRRFVAKAMRLQRSYRSEIEGQPAPSHNDEYLILQTFVGLWQPNMDFGALIERVKSYLIKAAREAKERTSWIDPDPEYESALLKYIDGYCSKQRQQRFLTLLSSFAEPIAFFGSLNGLAAMALKLLAPGVPDFYQGSELPELTLVDPDNRHPIDFEARLSLLEQSPVGATDISFSALHSVRYEGSERLKSRLIMRLLDLRRDHASLFAMGDYLPLEVRGSKAEHVIAFMRRAEGRAIVVVIARWLATQTASFECMFPNADSWADTQVALPAECSSSLVDVFSNQSFNRVAESPRSIPCSALLARLPLAVLVTCEESAPMPN